MDCLEGWTPEDYQRDGGGVILFAGQSVNFMSAWGNLAGMALGYAGDRKVWAQTLIVEKQGICRQGCWVGFCLLLLPTLPREEVIGEGLE